MAAKNWIGIPGASWTTATAWSTGTAATAADSVTIAASQTQYQSITGNGAAASLALTGDLALPGTFSLGALTIGLSGTIGALALTGQTSATSATLADGTLQATGPTASFAVSGALTLGIPRTAYDYGFIADTLAATAGARIQAGSLVLQGSALVTDSVTIDSASSLEIGTAGAPAAGTLTIDSARSLLGAGTIRAANGIANQGTILAQGGTLALSGPIAGTGQLQIAASGTLDLSAVTTDAERVAFTGTGGTLVLGTYRGPYVAGMPIPSLNQQGTISGFAQGDTIAYAGPGTVTSAAWNAATGTLTLYGNATTLGTLTLAGDFTGYGFQVTPGASPTISDITLVTATTIPYTGPGPGTASRDVYTWTAPGSGSWNDAASWKDTTTGQTLVAPGANDVVTIMGPSAGAYQVVSGAGDAATLTLAGDTTLRGFYQVGVLGVGTASSAGALCISAGAVVAAAAANLLDGPILVSGAGATLRVSGALTLGSPPSPYDYTFVNNALTLAAGALAQADSLLLQGGALVTDSIAIDSASSLEIGQAGTAAAGTLTIDAGKLASGLGTIRAANGILDNGTILAQGGTLRLAGTAVGTGTMLVGAGATLDVSTSLNAVATAFTGLGATLQIGGTTAANGTPQLTQQAAVAGFLPGDTIAYYGPSNRLTSVTWSAATGALTLWSGTALLGTLALAGDYANDTFQVTQGASPTIANITATANTTPVASAGTTTPDAYTWSAANGAWGTATNWTDRTTGTTAQVAAGRNDSVAIGPGTHTITGAGNAASLSLQGTTALNGTFQAGAVTLGTSLAPATLTLGPGSLAAASLAVAAGQVVVAGNGASLAVAGTATIGSTGPGTLTLTAGATAQLGTLAINGALALDASSALEIGNQGAATAGRLTVDLGATLTAGGTIAAAAIIDRGDLVSQGTLTLGAPVSGNGILHVGIGATLVLASTTPSTAPITFDGAVSGSQSRGTLALRSTAAGSLNEQGTISSFLLGDHITYTGQALTGVTYQANGDGTGTLTLATATGVAGTLTLAGDYSGYGFTLVPGTTPGTSTIGLAITDPMFDLAYFSQHSPDIIAAGIDPYWHYINIGWREGRNPNAYFDTRFYLAQNPDVAAACYASNGTLNPMTQFETVGWTQGRAPSLLFSDAAYLAINPDVKAANVDPLVHYMQFGKTEGRQAMLTGYNGLPTSDPMVDATYFDAQLGATQLPGTDAQAQATQLYHAPSGVGSYSTGANPNAWFDSDYYLAHNPDVKAAGCDPLAHFEAYGWLEGRDPSLAFSIAGYLAAAPDVKAAGVDPLLHYLQFGQYEGRPTFLTGGSEAADPLVVATYFDKQLGATIVPAGTAGAQQAAWAYDNGGWQSGLNPNAWFDTNYYLSHNPDVAAAHCNPLVHYEVYGWKEGRDPSAQFSTRDYLTAYPDVAAANMDPLLHYVASGQYEGRMTFPV